MTQARAEVALFAVGLTIAGLVVLALLWSGDRPYEDMARANGVSGAVFLMGSRDPRANVPVDLGTLAQWHHAWTTYVTGGSDRVGGPGIEDWFTGDEIAHMADVRRVFDGAKLLVPAGMFIMALRMQRARARGLDAMLRLVRDGAIAAGLAVAGIGIVATFAFDAAFLLFHQIFFPQGNFLFDPATSNLVRLYPDWYWQGITLRVGLSFLALAAALTLATSIGLRRAGSTKLPTA